MAVLAIIAVSCLFKEGSLAHLLKESGPINLFAKGYSEITHPILSSYGAFVAIAILNAFILTTLDTATRISRYLTEELFAIKNRYLSTAIVICASGLLAFSGKWSKIWSAFGASNQLVAALALFVIGSWLVSKKKPAKIFLIPAILVMLTTITALLFQFIRYLKTKEIILAVISAALIILALFIIGEINKKFRRTDDG